MKRIFVLILIFVGTGVAVWGLHTLLLRSLGERGAARIVSVDTGEATTEIIRQRRSAPKATGYYRIDIKVRYTFDVLPTPVEALRRASEEPLQHDINGRDKLYYKVRQPNAAPVKVGDPVAVRYWRFLPSLNAADQPRSTFVKGSYELGGGGMILLIGLTMYRRGSAHRSKKWSVF